MYSVKAYWSYIYFFFRYDKSKYMSRNVERLIWSKHLYIKDYKTFYLQHDGGPPDTCYLFRTGWPSHVIRYNTGSLSSPIAKILKVNKIIIDKSKYSKCNKIRRIFEFDHFQKRILKNWILQLIFNKNLYLQGGP